MNGKARSINDRKNDWSGVGVSGKMNVSVTVYSSANVPKNATVFSKRYKGRILEKTEINDDLLRVNTTYRSVLGYSSS